MIHGRGFNFGIRLKESSKNRRISSFAQLSYSRGRRRRRGCRRRRRRRRHMYIYTTPSLRF